MLKLIVPPPMALASRIAWRNEPVPLSFVLLTVKTKGVPGLFLDFPATVACGALGFRIRSRRGECVVLNELAKIEANKIEQTNINARVSAIRRAKARGEVFFFMVSLGWDVGDEGGGWRYSIFLYGKTRPKFQKNTLF